MEKRVYNKFRQIIYQKSGISLGDTKESLVAARVNKRLRELKLTNYNEYLTFLQDDSSGTELVRLIDVISTNVTSFFREAVHFQFLQQQMECWLNQGYRRFRFWSAACSSGEEPYTMAMVLLQCTTGYTIDMRILATDIATSVLERAMNGYFPEEKVTGIPKPLLERYFDIAERNGTCWYRAGRELRDMILFRRLNLSETPFPMNGPMDIVFCRNVMIYFDNTVRRKLLAEIERLLKPGGYLFVGHAESLTGQLCALKPIRPSIYVKG